MKCFLTEIQTTNRILIECSTLVSLCGIILSEIYEQHPIDWAKKNTPTVPWVS